MYRNNYFGAKQTLRNCALYFTGDTIFYHETRMIFFFNTTAEILQNTFLQKG